MGGSGPGSPAAIGCCLAGNHGSPSVIGWARCRAGLAAGVVGREVASLAVGPRGHTHTTVAAAGRTTCVSVRAASSHKDVALGLAAENGGPRLRVVLVDDQLIPAAVIGGSWGARGTPIGWRLSPEGILILGSQATLWGRFCRTGEAGRGEKNKHTCGAEDEIPWQPLGRLNIRILLYLQPM